MEEKESYTPTEVAIIYYATLYKLRLSTGCTTSTKEIREYDKIVPKNVRNELTKLCLLTYSDLASLLEKEVRK